MQHWLKRSWIQIVAGALCLMAMVLLNGRPTVFTDTDDYYAQGRGAAHAVKPLIQKLVRPVLPSWGSDDDADYRTAAQDEDHTSMAARSPYYGVFLYTSYRIGSLWLTVFLQSLVVAWTVFLFLRGVFESRSNPLIYLGIMAAISLGTSAPFFTGFAMPDILAPLGALATIALGVAWSSYRRRERLGLAFIILTSLWSHTSHILVEIALIAAIAILLFWRKTPWPRIATRSGLMLALVGSAFASDAAYHSVVLWRTGEDLRRPPFLTARVLADGPGRLYLRQVCASQSPYVLCAFKRDPLDNSDEILWADDPARGIFNASKMKVRTALDKEEKAFVLAAVSHYPMEQLAASLANWWDQLNMIDLAEPLRDPTYYFSNVYWRDTSLPGLIPGGGACLKHPKLCRPRLSIVDLWHVHATVLFAAIAFLAWRLSAPDMRKALFDRKPLAPGSADLAAVACLLTLFAVVINAGVTGVLSGPFSRYNARIIWLVPLVALALGVSRGPGWPKVWQSLDQHVRDLLRRVRPS